MKPYKIIKNCVALNKKTIIINNLKKPKIPLWFFKKTHKLERTEIICY